MIYTCGILFVSNNAQTIYKIVHQSKLLNYASRDNGWTCKMAPANFPFSVVPINVEPDYMIFSFR